MSYNKKILIRICRFFPKTYLVELLICDGLAPPAVQDEAAYLLQSNEELLASIWNVGQQLRVLLLDQPLAVALDELVLGDVRVAVGVALVLLHLGQRLAQEGVLVLKANLLVKGPARYVM